MASGNSTSGAAPSDALVVGTAGHVDHGKTTLATYLTGIATDRLREEQERGISIELGFAWLDLPNGGRCALIDVPGHEKFVRQMIAGAAGVDAVLLVVAADEGVMPQTREHLDICRLLGVKRGITVLTKVDLADADWLDLVTADLEETVRGTFLEGAPVFQFSSVDLKVAERFRGELLQWLAAEKKRSVLRDPNRPFRLSIDRAFVMKGFGAVVTGTAATGTLHVGDDVEVLPLGLRSKVRGLQVHGAAAIQATAGSRVAVNLQGAERQELSRGQVLVSGSILRSTSMFDAICLVLPNVPRLLEPRTKALVHVGTDQIPGIVVPLCSEVLEPGQQGLVQIRLERPTVVQAGEAYVLRGFEVFENYGKTIGGGVILDPLAQRHKALRADVLEPLRVLERGEPAEATLALVGLGGARGLTWPDLLARSSLGQDALRQLLQKLEAEGRVVGLPGEPPLFVTTEQRDQLISQLGASLSDWHLRYPWRPGMPAEELRGQVRPPMEPRLFAHVAEEASRTAKWRREGELVRQDTFVPVLEGEILRAYSGLLSHYRAAGLEPPLTTEALAGCGAPESVAREAMDLLVREGKLVRTKADLVFDCTALTALQARLVSFLGEHGEITTTQFKDLTGLSRKFSIPLSEYFDQEKITVRSSDTVRKLRPKL